MLCMVLCADFQLGGCSVHMYTKSPQMTAIILKAALIPIKWHHRGTALNVRRGGGKVSCGFFFQVFLTCGKLRGPLFKAFFLFLIKPQQQQQTTYKWPKIFNRREIYELR